MLKGYEKYKSVNAFGMDKVPLQWNVKRTFSCLIENKKECRKRSDIAIAI